MGRLFADTDQTVEDDLIARLRDAPPWRKLAMVAEMNAATRGLLLLGLRACHPGESPDRLRRRFAHQLYSPDVATKLIRPIAEETAMPQGPIAVLLQMAGILEQLDVPYAVSGSLASALHGVARSTLDIDIIAALEADDVTPLLEALGDDFYADEAMLRDAVARQGNFNLIHIRLFYKVDVFVATSRLFDRQQLARRVRQVVDEATQGLAFVLSPEDIILAKLDWYRLGGMASDRQWQDILGVLATQSERLDESYLHHGAVELGVLDLLERALAEGHA